MVITKKDKIEQLLVYVGQRMSHTLCVGLDIRLYGKWCGVSQKTSIRLSHNSAVPQGAQWGAEVKAGVIWAEEPSMAGQA